MPSHIEKRKTGMMLPLRNQGKYLALSPPRRKGRGKEGWVTLDADPPKKGLIQFSLVGPKYGILATEFITVATMRRIARAMLRFANEIEGKPPRETLKCLLGGRYEPRKTKKA